MSSSRLPRTWWSGHGRRRTGMFGTGVISLCLPAVGGAKRLSLRIDVPLLRRMVRFGLRRCPPKLTLYSLNFIDQIIVRLAGSPVSLVAVVRRRAPGPSPAGSSWRSRRWRTRSDDDGGAQGRRARKTHLVRGVRASLAAVGPALLARWLLRRRAADEFWTPPTRWSAARPGDPARRDDLRWWWCWGTGRHESGCRPRLSDIGLNLWRSPEQSAPRSRCCSDVVVVILMYVFSQGCSNGGSWLNTYIRTRTTT